MENKYIENSDIVKSEKEDENEQIQNGGTTIILKDDGKTVNTNDYIDKPTTNKKAKNKSKSGKNKEKEKTKEKNR
jgi:TfoX/Sxy family transcriptional regulator of competence genes